MPHHKYLIVGGGMTADAAVRGIRALDETGAIGLVTEEPYPPYERPPLSKRLWLEEKASEEDVDRATGDMGAVLHLGRRITRIDPDDRTVTDDRGVIYTYDRLLLATGGRPRTLPDAPPQVVYYRTRDDYRRLRRLVADGRSFAVIGGGFIGSEIAAALASNGKGVSIYFPESGIGASVLPENVSEWLNDLYRSKGVDVHAGAGVASVRRSGDRLLVATEEGDGSDTFRADGVVAGLGIVPNQELAETAGLDVLDLEEDCGGIVVDEHLRTSAPDVWAAGDVAAIWSPTLGKRRRVEHEDQANRSGTHAGRAMAGAEDPYDHLPYFYSDLFDVGYEAVGEVDPELRVVEDWEEPFERGILYYVDAGKVRGVLLWNVWGKLDEARELIRSGASYGAGGLRGKIAFRG